MNRRSTKVQPHKRASLKTELSSKTLQAMSTEARVVPVTLPKLKWLERKGVADA
jgi:hypothetical protein